MWLQYAVWALAVFLAAAWTFGLVRDPRQRIGSTIVTVMLWWVAIAVAALQSFNVFHLLWIFPAALLAPALLLARRL